MFKGSVKDFTTIDNNLRATNTIIVKSSASYIGVIPEVFKGSVKDFTTHHPPSIYEFELNYLDITRGEAFYEPASTLDLPALLKINETYYTYNGELVESALERIEEEGFDLTLIDDWSNLYNAKIYVLTQAEQFDNIKLEIDIAYGNVIKYLVSPDKLTWWGYNGVGWLEGYHMSKVQFESLTGSVVRQLIDPLHEEGLYYKTVLFSYTDEQPTLEDITTTFLENQAPIFLEANVLADEIHNNHAEVSAKLTDLEDDEIEYRITINSVVVEDWKPLINQALYHAYSYEYFEVGTNQLTIEARDQRGAYATPETFTVQLDNDAPLIEFISYNDFGLNASVSDEYGYKVTYQIELNGSVVVPFGEFIEGPIQWEYYWDDAIPGEQNTVIVTAKDEHGETSSKSHTFIGQYVGLLFVDSDDQSYIDGDGNKLRYLDLGTILAGINSSKTKATALNNSKQTIQELSLEAENIDLPKSSRVYLSFDEEEEIKTYEKTMKRGDRVDFYIQILSDKKEGGAERKFNIVAKADTIGGESD